jgi:hypothetical protein
MADFNIGTVRFLIGNTGGLVQPPALIRGLAAAFPFVRLRLPLSSVGCGTYLHHNIAKTGLGTDADRLPQGVAIDAAK